jgi:hypothetical protein
MLSSYERKLMTEAIKYAGDVSKEKLMYHAILVASSLYVDCEEQDPIAISTLEEIKNSAKVEIEGFDSNGIEYREYIEAGFVIVSKYINFHQMFNLN